MHHAAVGACGERVRACAALHVCFVRPQLRARSRLPSQSRAPSALRLAAWPAAGNVEAVDEAADQYGLVLLTSDHDHDVGPGGMLSASRVEEGFDSSATSNTASTLVQVRAMHGGLAH